MVSSLKLTEIYPRRRRWIVRLGGPLLALSVIMLGVAIDARNPPLTTIGPSIGALFGAPFAAALATELYFSYAPKESKVEFRLGLGRVGRLLVHTVIAGVILVITYLALGLLTALIGEGLTSLLGIPAPSDNLRLDLSIILSGLLIGNTVPRVLLSVPEQSNKQPEPEETETDSSPDHEASVDSPEETAEPEPEIQDTLEAVQEQLDNRRYEHAQLGLQQIRSRLDELRDEGIDISEVEQEFSRLYSEFLKEQAETHLNTANNALEDGELETAQSALDDLRELLSNAENTAEANLSVNVDIQELREDAEKLEAKIEAREDPEKADKRLIGLLGSIGASKSHAERLLQDAKEDAATKRREAALETCEEAKALNDEFGLGRGDRISEFQTELEHLTKDHDHEFVQRARELIESTRTALDTGDFKTAHDRLETLEAHLSEQSTDGINGTEELKSEATELRRDLLDQITERIDERVTEATEAHQEAETLLKDGEYETAATRGREGIDACNRGLELEEEYDVPRHEELHDLHAELEALTERASEIAKLVTEAEEHRDTARRAIQSREYNEAEATLEKLETTVDELEEYNAQSSVVDPFKSAISEFRNDVSAKQEESRVNGLLGSVTSARQRAEEYLEKRSYEKAIRRLESAEESLDEAAELNERYDLGRDNAIRRKQEKITTLLNEAEEKPAEELSSTLTEAEKFVSVGIEHRETEDIQTAVDAFENAQQEYSAALDLAAQHELPQQWEVEQRHSMVNEYLEVAESELNEQQHTVIHELEQILSKAESAITRAEQHQEVDDIVSARESLSEAVGHLDDATELLNTGMANESLQENYEDLVSRANELHSVLPDKDESGEYRTRDLVESLQLLATKLGESPRPEFVTAYGEYPADAYLEAFGSWPEALAAASLDPIDEAARERRTYSRVEILDAIVDLAEELGHPPSKGEMNEHGDMSASPGQARFTDWETALELAGVTDRDLEEESETSDEPTTSTNTTGETNRPEESDKSQEDEEDDTSESDDVVDKLLKDMNLNTDAEKAHE